MRWKDRYDNGWPGRKDVSLIFLFRGIDLTRGEGPSPFFRRSSAIRYEYQ